MSEWRPSSTHYRRTAPTVGEVVAYDYRAWEITSARTADREHDEPTWGTPPYTVTLRRLYGAATDYENSARDIGLRIRAGAHNALPSYRDGRVPLCSCHGHPWPCLDADQAREAAEAISRAERELALLPGCCPACQEVVTHRQRSITFPGPYVHNPLAAENPRFHLRGKCWRLAAAYEEAWVAANPATATRSLLTLRCEGTLVVHELGRGECFGADSECPSLFAKHRLAMACWHQSHGCPTCDPTSRHGTMLAGYPTDPRDLHGAAS